MDGRIVKLPDGSWAFQVEAYGLCFTYPFETALRRWRGSDLPRPADLVPGEPACLPGLKLSGNVLVWRDGAPHCAGSIDPDGAALDTVNHNP